VLAETIKEPASEEDEARDAFIKHVIPVLGEEVTGADETASQTFDRLIAELRFARTVPASVEGEAPTFLSGEVLRDDNEGGVQTLKSSPASFEFNERMYADGLGGWDRDNVKATLQGMVAAVVQHIGGQNGDALPPFHAADSVIDVMVKFHRVGPRPGRPVKDGE